MISNSAFTSAERAGFQFRHCLHLRPCADEAIPSAQFMEYPKDFGLSNIFQPTIKCFDILVNVSIYR